MKTILGFARRNQIALLVTLVHWLASFPLETRVIEASRMANLDTWLPCKLLLGVCLFLFWRLVVGAVRRRGPERSILLCALPCLLFLAVLLLTRHPFQLTGDELNIYQRAILLDDFAYWFTYFTGWYCVTCLMVIPHFMGPTIVKIVLQALTAGYCVHRGLKTTGSRWALLLYGMFLLPPMQVNGISAHRMPTYGVLYLFFAAKLVFDWLDRRPLSRPAAVGMCALCAVLTYWRSEGIYLLAGGIVLLAAAYRVRGKRALTALILLFYAMELAAGAAQTIKSGQEPAPAGLRLKPFYAYAITNMLRCGLTEEMAAEELAVIDTYIPLESIRTINEQRGDEAYTRSYALMEARSGVSYEQQLLACSAALDIILSHPLIYLRSQWGGWVYTNTQYPLGFSGGAEGLLTGLSNLSWQLFIPLGLLLVFCLAALVRKKWLVFFLTGCGMGNWLIVMLLQPAAFFKYYYPVWLLGYFLLTMAAAQGLARLERRRSPALGEGAHG